MDQFTNLCENLRAKSRSTDSMDSLHLDDDNIAGIAEALHRNKHGVEFLSLNISLVTTQQASGLERLLRFVQASTSLQDFRLLGSDNRALRSVVKRFLQAIHKNEHLERLSLHNVGLEADSFARLVRHSQRLTHLCLAGCSVTDGKNNPHYMAKIGDAFNVNRSIETLRLVALEESFLNTILGSIKSRRQLRRLDVAYGSVASAEAIGEVVGSTLTPVLKTIVLRDSSLLSLESIVRSMTSNNKIAKFEIHNCDLDSVSAALLRALFRSKQHSIEEVSLCDLDVEDESNLEDVFDGLGRGSTVSHLRIHHVDLQKEGLSALVRMLMSNKRLSHVNLDRKILSAIAHDKNTNSSTEFANKSTTRYASDDASTKLVFSRRTGMAELQRINNSTIAKAKASLTI